MAEDAEDELEDAAEDRHDAVPERLRRPKRKKEVSGGSVQGQSRVSGGSVKGFGPAGCAALL